MHHGQLYLYAYNSNTSFHSCQFIIQAYINIHIQHVILWSSNDTQTSKPCNGHYTQQFITYQHVRTHTLTSKHVTQWPLKQAMIITNWAMRPTRNRLQHRPRTIVGTPRLSPPRPRQSGSPRRATLRLGRLECPPPLSPSSSRRSCLRLSGPLLLGGPFPRLGVAAIFHVKIFTSAYA